MIVVYLSLLLVFGVVGWLMRRRVARLERRFCKAAGDADAYLKQTTTRGGNNRHDPFVTARQQFELARLAMQRDRIEARYSRWQRVSERFGRLTAWLRGYRGKVLPYLFGVADVALIAFALTHFGLTADDVKALLQR